MFNILNTGKQALAVQQRAIATTGHNIANANTDGYSRQRVDMKANEPTLTRLGWVGTGVNAKSIERVHDDFLSAQINTENSGLGNFEAHKSVLTKVEMAFEDSEEYGLNYAMSEFWNAAHDVVDDPNEHAARIVLVSKSNIMIETAQRMNSDLKQVQQDTNDRINGAVREINLITESIADLNVKISDGETNGHNANEFRDERDLLIEKLSSKINFNSFEGDDGKVTIITSNGRPLVKDKFSYDLSTENNPDSPAQSIILWNGRDGNTVDMTNKISNGELKGWLDVRDQNIPYYLDNLNNLAVSIMDEVNALHSEGFGLDGSTGNDFFTGTSIDDMAVNEVITEDTDKIAAAGNISSLPGDNSNAIKIANLQNKLTMNNSAETFNDYYRALVSDIGADTQKAGINVEHQKAVVTHLSDYKESIVGVSLDEEMVNLIKYQHAYEASAKLISVADEMLATVINM